MASLNPLLGGVRLMRLMLGIQMINANTANTAQTASEPRQPKLSSSANGTLNPAAKAAPSDMIPEYKLVTNPALCGKFLLINAGINTFPKAIAIPNKIVPRYSSKIPPTERMSIPAVSRIKAPKIVLPIPKRLVNKGVIVETTPNAIKGKVVSRPNKVSESPTSSRIMSINGPILESAGLKFIDTNNIPTSKSVRDVLFNPFLSRVSINIQTARL